MRRAPCAPYPPRPCAPLVRPDSAPRISVGAIMVLRAMRRRILVPMESASNRAAPNRPDMNRLSIVEHARERAFGGGANPLFL